MRVVIWKTAWLPASETFVRNQIAALSSWEASPVGIRRVESKLSDPHDRILFGAGRVERSRARLLQKTGLGGRLAQELRLTRPDVIHAHFASAGMIARRSARRVGVPLAVTLHGQDITAAPRAPGASGIYYRFRLRRLFRDAAVVIAVSDHLAKRAIELGADPGKVVVHHIGIPLAQSALTPGVTTALLGVGRLTEKKGFEHLIRAVAALPEDLKGVPVRIVGDGPLLGSLQALALELGVAVDFAGFLPSDEVRRMMAQRPLVCIPSVRAANGDEEGLPTVAMEAAAAGCAVAGYQHSGLPDIVESGVTGVLVTEGDVAALSAQLAALLGNPQLMASMGVAAREKVIAEFDIVEQTVKLEAIYASAVTAKARGSISMRTASA
jgi:colanic acid/amylovoran biosynthesis glycosyltransferase